MSHPPLIPSSSSLALPEPPMTRTILGCGTLGTAILSGILSSISSHPSTAPSPAYPDSSTATTTTPTSPTPPRTPSRFIACVLHAESAKRICTALSTFPAAAAAADDRLTIFQNDNIKGAQQADIVILACKPSTVSTMLTETGMRSALSGKLLISILAGVSASQISSILTPSYEPQTNPPPIVIRAMPNTAATIRESMTVIATPTPPLPEAQAQLVDWIFTRIGRVTHLPPNHMDISTALCGSGPAFLSLMLEALADGAVAMGLLRAEAQLMAAQTMRGTAGMVLGGEHPALIREKVSTPGGCTVGGLMVLEEGGVRGTIARGVREAAGIAAELGKGGVGVSGTRFGGG